MRLITTEEKIGKCIYSYGSFEFEKRKPDDVAWRIIYDLTMFAKSIYITIASYEEWEKEEYENILDILQKKFIKKTLDSVFIRRCPNDQASFLYEPFFLRLVYIAFVLEKDRLILVRQFIEIYYYWLEYNSNQSHVTKEFEALNSLLEDHWQQKILELYKKYATVEYEAWFILKNHCIKITGFIENLTNDNSAPFHQMLNE